MEERKVSAMDHKAKCLVSFLQLKLSSYQIFSPLNIKIISYGFCANSLNNNFFVAAFLNVCDKFGGSAYTTIHCSAGVGRTGTDVFILN